MNMRFDASAVTLIRTPIVKAAITALLLLLIQGVSFGQAYSYSDISAGGDFVYAYGSVTGYYNSSTHVSNTSVRISSPSGRTTTANGGESASASLSIDGESGWFYVNTAHNGTCPYGNSHTIGGSGGSTEVQCTDTCTPCRATRNTQTNTCYAVFATCTGAAGAAYITCRNNCENQNFCQSGNPNYNEEECNRCKNSCSEVLAIAEGACGTTLALCLNGRVDCSLPFYKKGPPMCEQCSND